MGDHIEEVGERVVVAPTRCGQDLLDDVVARDVDRVHPIHPIGDRPTLPADERQPSGRPRVERIGLGEQRPGGLGVAADDRRQRTQAHRVVDTLLAHQRKEVADDVVAVRHAAARHAGVEADLGAHDRRPRGLEPLGERLQHSGRRLDRRVGVVVEQRQHRLGEASKIPRDDRRLVAVGVATAVVDRAEYRRRVVGIHERARAVVDRLARDGRVVGVHHAVDEPDRHPLRHERRLHGHDVIEQCERSVVSLSGIGNVAGDCVTGEPPEEFAVPARRRELERAHPDVAGRDPGEDSGRNVGDAAVDLPQDRLAGGHHGERPGSRDPERVHRLADHVLAQHRPERGASVAASGERRPPGPLEVEVESCAVAADDLAEQQRPSVAEPWRVAAELMAGVRLRHGGDARGRVVAGEDRHAGGGAQRLDIEAESAHQLLVEDHERRVRHRFCLPWLVQPDQLAGERVVECEHGPCINGHAPSLGRPIAAGV